MSGDGLIAFSIIFCAVMIGMGFGIAIGRGEKK